MVPKITVRHNCSDISSSMANVPEIWSKSNTYDLPTLDSFPPHVRQVEEYFTILFQLQEIFRAERECNDITHYEESSAVPHSQ
jgi:hypothetical protein